MAAADRHTYPTIAPVGRTGCLGSAVVGYTVGTPVEVDVDVVDPTVSNLTPPVGTAVVANQAIGFDITDDSGTVHAWVRAEFPRLSYWEVVHDGYSFAPNYEAGSTRSSIAGGYRFSLRRAGGWPGAPTLTARALDSSGNEAD